MRRARTPPHAITFDMVRLCALWILLFLLRFFFILFLCLSFYIWNVITWRHVCFILLLLVVVVLLLLGATTTTAANKIGVCEFCCMFSFRLITCFGTMVPFVSMHFACAAFIFRFYLWVECAQTTNEFHSIILEYIYTHALRSWIIGYYNLCARYQHVFTLSLLFIAAHFSFAWKTIDALVSIAINIQ